MPHTVRHSRNPWWLAGLVCCCLLDLSGCSLFVMTGKMLQGDPMNDDEFKHWYGKSMEKSGKKVAVLCSTPESLKSEFSSLDMDLSSEVSRKLGAKKIKVIPAHKVASWMDDHGGNNVDTKKLGDDLGAELVVSIKVDHFDYREENSPDLFRGRAQGSITVYELIRDPEKGKSKFAATDDTKSEEKSDKKNSQPAEKMESPSDRKDKSESTEQKVTGIRQVFLKSFDLVYPLNQPVTIEQMKPDMFRKKFLDRVGDDLSRTFYKHKAGVDF